MPTWCRNKVTVLGPTQTVEEFRARARGPVQLFTQPQYPGQQIPTCAPIETFSFHRLHPLSDQVLRGSYSRGGRVHPGHDAEIAHWGVKWGGHASAVLRHVQDAGWALLTYRFLNPWEPPCPLYRFLARAWPRLTFVVSYAQESPARGRFLLRQAETITFADQTTKLDKRGLKWERALFTTHDAWVDALWSDPLTRQLAVTGDLTELATILTVPHLPRDLKRKVTLFWREVFKVRQPRRRRSA